MLSSIRQLFEQQLEKLSTSKDAGDTEHAYRLATAALLVEMARADFEVKEAEREAVANAIRRAFDLRADETADLMALAEREVDAATSLHQFTTLMNAHLGPAEKEHVVELMWRVAFADGSVDKYEEHLVRKISDLLHVRHRDFIRAKLKVKEQMG